MLHNNNTDPPTEQPIAGPIEETLNTVSGYYWSPLDGPCDVCNVYV